MFGVTSLAPCAMLLSKADTLICNLSAERFKFSNSGSLTRWLIYFGSLASVCSQLKRPQKSLIRSTSHPLFFFTLVQKEGASQKRFGCCLSYPLRGLASSMFASHFVAQTTLLGDALLPQSPCKTRSKRTRFEPKKETGNVSISVSFSGKIKPFFSSLASKKMALYALDFPGV